MFKKNAWSQEEIEKDGDGQTKTEIEWQWKTNRQQIDTKLYAITRDIFVSKSKFITSVEFSPKRYVINNVRPTCLFIFSTQPRFDTRKILIHSNPQVIWVNKAIDDKDDDDDDDDKKRELIMCGGFGKPLPAHASLYHCLGRRRRRSCCIFTSKTTWMTFDFFFS